MRSSAMTNRAMASVAVAASLAAIVALPNQAEAATRSTMIQNVGNSRCMDANSSGALYMSPCQNGNDYQWFDITEYEPKDGAVNLKVKQIKHKKSGKCLQSNTPNVGAVFLASCEENFRQEWSTKKDQRWFNFNPDNCLDADAAHVYILPCSSSTHQKWNGIG